MVLEQQIPVLRESCRVVLETERLVLRRPTLADVKAIASLANDRRIAQNTSRLPHPYSVRDAETFIQFVDLQSRETNFAITRGGDLMGTIGIMFGRGEFPEIGYWLGCPTGARAMRPRPPARSSTTLSRNSAAPRSAQAHAWSTRPRAACWKSVASSGPTCSC